MTTVRAPNPWLPYLGRTNGARLRLFCFPYAGGSCTAFASWQQALSSAVDVCPVEFPGRMSRLREAPVAQFDRLIDLLTRAIAPHLDIPFAFFGFSMGSLIAFELTRRLARDRQREPFHLFVAARPAPHLPKATAEWTKMPDDEFLSELQRRYRPMPSSVLNEPGMRAIVLQIMRADLALLDSHEHRLAPALRCPLSALGGTRDPMVSRTELGAWREHTRNTFEAHLFEGDHFFLESNRLELLQFLRQRLLQRGAPATLESPKRAAPEGT
jgi:surfactin synthase thioesterase subunit